MKAVFLDYRHVNIGDLSWKPIEELCNLTCYHHTEDSELAERVSDADIIIMDSKRIGKSVMDAAPKLKLLLTAATGFNNIDIDEAKARNIAVANVPAYSTDAVAQHTIALLLGVTNKLMDFNGFSHSRANGESNEAMVEFYRRNQITLLSGKSIGIVGYGNIGKRVGEIAKSLGMKVNIYSRNREDALASDVISLHCPLNEQTTGLVDDKFISKMKDGAILLNTARGGLVDENALAEALRSGKISGAGLDVTSVEPLDENSPLVGCDNCIITPHIAFMPKETRQNIIDICAANIKSFMEGGILNRIV